MKYYIVIYNIHLWGYFMGISTELLSGIFGAIIGGGFTILGSHYSIKKQFVEQRKIEDEKNKMIEKIALVSIKGEIIQNLNHVDRLEDSLDTLNLDSISFKEFEMSSNLQNSRWSRHCDSIEMTAQSTLIDFTTLFYDQIGIVDSTNEISKTDVNILQTTGQSASRLISDYLSRFHNYN